MLLVTDQIQVSPLVGLLHGSDLQQLPELPASKAMWSLKIRKAVKKQQSEKTANALEMQLSRGKEKLKKKDATGTQEFDYNKYM